MSRTYAKVNSEILKWARGNTPFDVSDVAKNISVKEEDINSWESGEKYPTIGQAIKLAKLYKLPMTSFYYKSIPQKIIRNYNDRRILHGIDSREPSIELWKEVEKLYSLRNTILNIDNKISTNLPIINYSDTYEDIANKIKKHFCINDIHDYKEVRKAIEKNGIIVATIKKVQVSEMRGIAIYFDELPIIGINAKDTKNAKVFTIFHELIHILRHNSSLCLVNLDEKDDTEERVCNEIAAEILMPKNEILDKFNDELITVDTINDYSKEVNVSCYALLTRLYKLNIINYSKYKKIYQYCENKYIEFLNSEYNGHKIKTKYEHRYVNEHGYCFINSIINEYGEGNISFGETCIMLKIKSNNFTKILHGASFD